MKIIISHDIDHLTVFEHYKDPIIPKFIVRAAIERFKGKINNKELILRYRNLLKNKWQNLNELMEFEKKFNIPATYFIGVRKGRLLAYSNKQAKPFIKNIISNGFDIGVHGISYENFADIKEEYQLFKDLIGIENSGIENFGIRMHYLKLTKDTLLYLEQAGYLFDASILEIKQAAKSGNFWMFPLSIMDGLEINGTYRRQYYNLNTALYNSINKIEQAKNKGINYFSILFHDRYYDNSFITWKLWFEKLIEYCLINNYEFINYKQAIEEMKKGNGN